MAFNIVEGIVRLINSVGTAITSTTNGSKISLDTHVANTVSVPANVSSVVSGAVIDPRSPAIDTTSTGTITAAGQTVQIACLGYSSRGIVVTGSWSGVLVCEASSDNATTWSSVSIRNGALGADLGIVIPQILASITANGSYKPNNSGGITHVRIRASSFTTGSASVTLLNSASTHSFQFGQQAIIQNVIALPDNSSVTNLIAGGNFTGAIESTLGVAGIKVSLFTDQNCIVYVEQSQDTTPNWDIPDSYNYYASTSFGITVQAVSSYVRVRVVNSNALTATTSFRLQTVLCPIVEALPRTLDSDGNLKVAIKSNEDHYGFEGENTPTGEMRTIIPVRLAGTPFEGGTVDTNFWAVANTAGGTTTQANTIATLATNTTPNGATVLHSIRRARFESVAAMQWRGVIALSAGVTNNKRRFGVGYGATMPTITDGAYFQLNGTTFSIVLLSGGVETTIVNSGSFNGQLGKTYTPTTAQYTLYEIYWTGIAVWFVVNEVILHSITIGSSPLTATLSHYAYMDNVNSNSIITNNTLSCRISAIRRLGALQSQPTSKYTTGTQTGVTCKLGPGNIHGAIVHANSNNAVLTIYDGTSVAGTILYQTGNLPTAAGSQPLDFKGIPFYTGLFYTVTSQSANVILMYE